MSEPLGEKTEKATPKRLKDARERGQVAASRDLTMAAGTLGATAALAAGGALLLHRLTGAIRETLATFDGRGQADITAMSLAPVVTLFGTLLALSVGPVALAAAASGALTSLGASGFNLSVKALKVDWTRLSPKNGFRRLAPTRAGVDTVKALITCIVLGALAWRAGRALAMDSVAFAWSTPDVSAARAWAAGSRLLWQIGFALLAIGGLDYGIQRWRLLSSLKMTRQEVRDELRTSEANPEVKARVRRIQIDMVRRRMLQAVPRATVVLTNPTHFAVALEYTRERGSAPIVVAKGRDLIAARIRELAREHSVPVVENPPLARALYHECEVGEAIPGALFGAVAEVLAYLIRIKQLVL
jgi:flagellar biosynthetic protein FlhB